MIYRNFQDIQLSALGFGAMRLPVIDGDDSRIDETAALQMVDTAMQSGINYYDTAWGYHGEQSEIVMGRALGRYPRESFYLATKFPGYDAANWDKVEEIFEQQLKKLNVTYFDFYLFHNVCEMNIDAYLDDGKYGIYSYLMEQKRNGRIKHLGFSCHGDMPVLRRFLDAYGKDMEFCQLQLNYLDWSFQHGREKVDLLNSLNIPVWVMEPLRGGKLASLAPEYEEQLKALRPDEEIPAWAFRFLQSIPGVKMILSGMSNEDQLRKNLVTFAEEKPLGDKEMDTLLSIAKKMLSVGTVPCTACHYCVSHCPQELNIPHLLSLYNEHAYTGGGFIAPMALSALPADKLPTACLQCRSCEQVCPQQIRISEVLADFSQKLG
ncbi:MAG: aldo/keto reductase [Clostridia bacterium]|nr:aldo/keto reductase [Clostridia bacterium]